MAAVQFATSRVIRDDTGEISRLRTEACRWLRKPFAKPNMSQLALTQYALWDAMDNLAELIESNDPSLRLTYHIFLKQVLDARCKQLGWPLLPAHQTVVLLTEAVSRKKYLMPAFPDREFLRQWVAALRETNPRKFDQRARLLARRVTGPFSIAGWRLRTPAIILHKRLGK